MEVNARVVGHVTVNPDERMSFKHAHVTDGDFSGHRLVALSAIGSRFERCRFERLRVEDASLGSGTEVSEYIECSFDGSRMALSVGGFARFVRCSFRKVDFREW